MNGMIKHLKQIANEMVYYHVEIELMAKPAERLKCTAKQADGSPCPHERADQSEGATNRHCHAHRAEASRKYNASKLEQEHGKGFVKGVESMRDVLAAEFWKQGSGRFTGYECAELIRQAAGPMPVEKATA